MATNAKALIGGRAAATLTTVYTVPTGTTAIVLQLQFENTGAGANVVTIAATTDGANVRNLKVFTLAATEDKTVRWFLVLAAAAVLQLSATNANEVVYHISGLEIV